MRSLRTRLAVTLVLLVTLTVALIGIGVYAFVDASLRDRLVADARQQADFNLSVLLPAAVPAPTDATTFGASGLPAQFRLRGEAEVIADFGDGVPWVPARRPVVRRRRGRAGRRRSATRSRAALSPRSP